MQRVAFIFLYFFIISNLGAQTSFSTEPAVFIEEFSKYMSASKKKEIVEITDVFSKNWKSGKILAEQQKFIIKITNNMMYKQLPRDPYFELLLSNLDLYYKKKFSPSLLKQWQIISATLLDKNPKDYLFFLETANSLFTDNTFYRSDARRWYASNSNFEFEFVNNRVIIAFKTLDVFCDAEIDKIKIRNSNGKYYPDKKEWIGGQGRINWERVGKPESEVYVEFNKYKINFGTGGFTVDSALLTYPKISGEKIYGKLIERISQSSSVEQVKISGFPHFVSYEPTIEIKGIVGSEAIYKGGFTIQGAKTNSQNFGDGFAKIILLYEGKPFVEVTSAAFRLDSNKVMSQHAAVKIKADTGFISHPNVIFNYNFAQKKLLLTKGVEGMMRMPFSDNYHGVEIDVEQVIWDQKMPFIDFDMVSNDKAAYVETNTFFKKFLFEKQQGALSQNPLEKMFFFCRQYNMRAFNLNDYASVINSKKEFLMQQIMDLADDGFIYYFPENDSIYVRDKLYNWNSNNRGGKDYDVLRFASVISAKPNITYSFNTNDLKMEGVRKFTFSDSQNVLTIPTDQLLIIKKDKNLHFSGLIRAGRIDFYSKDFNFDYAGFQINNTTIDSMVIYYPDVNTNTLRKVESVLSNTYGRILIDKPNNKSGLKDFAEYPIFIAERGSEINYDRAGTHNHAYNADRFKFEIDPFTIDSLDNFTIAGFGFGGTLVSDGIFPDIKNTARIQPDYSLGFIDKVSLPMYGKGKGNLTINLSNRGFYGSGEIIYQTSISKSTEYLLLPDATVGNSSTFDLPESSKYPLVAGNNVRTEWYPKQDIMHQTKLDSNFRMFKMQYAFDGKLSLSPHDLRGDGRLIWNEAIFASNDMVFGRNKANAAASSIKIFAVDPSKFAFECSNVKGDVNFDTRIGKFTTNVTGAYTHFPYNHYASNMNDYTWNMNKKTMEVKPGPAMGTLKPIFAGLPQNAKDSVKFECHYAKFDLVENVLYMEKIPYIDVADSRVFPFAGKATVREAADMDRLDSSRIEANRIDKFHEIKNCRTKILGGNNLAATGYYRYIDKYKIEQPLYVDSIRIDRENHLVGFGRISEDKILNLDKKIGFKGSFQIISIRRPIEFIGFVRPMHSFTKMETLWLRYKNIVDPQNVIIDVHDPRDKDNKRLSVGLYYANDSNHVYPIMFDLKRRYSDPELQSDTGILFYDNAKDAFFIGNEDKLKNKALKGNFIQFNEKDKSVYTEGRYDFNVAAPKVTFISAGSAIHSADDSTFRFNLMMCLDFPFTSDIKSKILKILTAEGAGSNISTLNTAENKMGINELISDEKLAGRMVKTLESSGNISPDGEFKSGFVFTGVDLAFNRIKRKFIATGSIQIPLFAGTVINKSFSMSIAVEKKRSGDKIYIYIMTDNGDWIYFEYLRGNMTIATNNADLAAAVTAESSKMSDDQFLLRLGTERMKENFLIRNEADPDE